MRGKEEIGTYAVASFGSFHDFPETLPPEEAVISRGGGRGGAAASMAIKVEAKVHNFRFGPENGSTGK